MSSDNSQSTPAGHKTFKIDVPVQHQEAFTNLLARQFFSGNYIDAERVAKDLQDNEIQSLQHVLEVATTQICSGARVCASILGSCYNGNRVKVDLTDLRLLDSELLEHVLNVLRLDHLCVQEIHTYFEDGGAIWEQMIKDWDLEKDDQQ